MRIRIKQGVALFGTIAGAAVATALVIYNVNSGSGNSSDVENVGLMDDLDETIDQALSDMTAEATAAAIANAQSGDAAATAGLLGSGFGTPQDKESNDTAAAETQETSAQPAQSEAGGQTVAGSETQTNEGGNAVGVAPAQVEQGEVVPAYEAAAPVAEEQVQTYVEAVPQTRTETVVSERQVVVDTPVTVTTEVPVEVTQEVQTGDFYQQSGGTAADEITTNRRQQEAEAAKAADMERLRAAQEETRDYVTGDDVKTGDGDFVIFY